MNNKLFFNVILIAVLLIVCPPLLFAKPMDGEILLFMFGCIGIIFAVVDLVFTLRYIDKSDFTGW
ncbi:hypothetical protein TP70_05470 [Staphylococcus microti]|uniref:Uncharacterized protein n=1 Tax=Staphylococcus microti TaxID=569857 RepID=A0A0D6XRS3_9STAP|nr:hypothetical protein [Staphylococcus microti]KIX90926.1 hypothetical protein TP70_05470 [Staphylococcus microti]PNZ83791.1 hypothetical protein CD132_01680 [Staphylococcus microti]SUM58503.1 Uncharacterised protein [Staphylococcus microti]